MQNPMNVWLYLQGLQDGEEIRMSKSGKVEKLEEEQSRNRKHELRRNEKRGSGGMYRVIKVMNN